jgi:hypothetical protein
VRANVGREGYVSEVVVLKAVRTNKILPPGYKLDHDPGVATLRRCGDGSVVAYYPMWSFQPVAALQAAKEDLARRVVRTM